MNCKKIQDLLMTDFLDGELEGSRRQQIDDHLKTCPACLEVKQHILEASVHPFQGLTQIKPPKSVWEKIEGRLDQEERQPVMMRKIAHLVETTREGCAKIFSLPKPVLAVALGAILVVVVFATLKLPVYHQQEITGTYLAQEMSYLHQLGNAKVELVDENGSLGTAIETLFL